MKINFNPIIFNSVHYKKPVNNAGISSTKKSCAFVSDAISLNNNLIYFTSHDTRFGVTKIPSLNCPICKQTMLNQKQMQEFIKEVSDKKGEELIQVFEKYEDNGNFTSNDEGGGKKTIFRPKQQEIVDVIKNLAKEYPDCNLKGLVNKKALSINDSEANNKQNYVCYFFKNAANKDLSSQMIASKLITPSITSKEHIHPKAKHGPNALSNYLCDCQNCNQERHELDFYIWHQQNPSLAQNLQDYIYDVEDAINDGHLNYEKYDKYIDDFIETISKESRGEINLQKPDAQQIAKRHEAKFEKRKETITKMKAQIDSLLDEVENLSIENANLKNDEQYHNIACYLRCLTAITSNNQQLKNTQRTLEELEKNKEKSMKRKVKSKHLARIDAASSEIKKLEKRKEKLELNLQTYYEAIAPERELMHLDKNDKDYESKLEKKTRLEGIYNKIKDNEKEIARLREIIQNNRNVMLKLKDYTNMEDESFENFSNMFIWS